MPGSITIEKYIVIHIAADDTDFILRWVFQFLTKKNIMIKPTLSAHKLIHIQITLALCSSSLGLQFYMWTFFSEEGGESLYCSGKGLKTQTHVEQSDFFLFMTGFLWNVNFVPPPSPILDSALNSFTVSCVILFVVIAIGVFIQQSGKGRDYQRKLKGTKILTLKRWMSCFDLGHLPIKEIPRHFCEQYIVNF